jgi:Tn3 transposase DDE domain
LGVVPLLDMLTKAALRTGCPAALTPLRTRREIDPSALTERLKLLIYAYGTNTGVRAVAAGDHDQRGQPALHPQPVLHRPRLASDS